MSEKSEAKSKGTSRRDFIAATGAAIGGLAVGAVIGSQAFPKVVELAGVTRTETSTRTTTATVTAPGAATTTTVTAPAATTTVTAPSAATTTTVTAPGATTTVTTTAAAAPVDVIAAEGGFAYVQPKVEGLACVFVDWQYCRGCGLCETACSKFHYNEYNRELARIRVNGPWQPSFVRFPTLCSYCPEEYQACIAACPVTPKAISYDPKTFVITVDKARCLGYKCGKCRVACPGKNIYFYPEGGHDYALVCDLCFKDGKRDPQCVKACPNGVLTYWSNVGIIHGGGQGLRIDPDEIWALLEKRFYPVTSKKRVRMPDELGL